MYTDFHDKTTIIQLRQILEEILKQNLLKHTNLIQHELISMRGIMNTYTLFLYKCYTLACLNCCVNLIPRFE